MPSLRSLKENAADAFHDDVQHRPWHVRPLLLLGAKLGVRTISARHAPPHEPLTSRTFPLTVDGFFVLMVGFLLQFIAALGGA